MLRVRRKWSDVLMLTVAGVGLIVLAVVVPEPAAHLTRRPGSTVPDPGRRKRPGHAACCCVPRPLPGGQVDSVAQIRPSSLTASRSSTSSAAVASILPREKSSISRPWTISQSPSRVVTG